MTIAALQALIDEEIPGIRRLPAPRLHPEPSRGGTAVDTHTAVAVSMYKDGAAVDAIIEATGLTQDQIGAAVTASGTPFVVARDANALSTLADVRPQDSAPAGLIAWGMQHSSSRMQRLADQARTALAELQQAQRRELVVTAAEARVRQAREQLADAEQALRTAKGTKNTASTPVVGGPRSDKAVSARIRAWAREQGESVGPLGIIPRRVVDAYHDAHAQL